MNKVFLALLFCVSGESFSEIYSESSEKHLDVLTCNYSDPFEIRKDIHLARESFGEKISIDMLVDKLLYLDVELKAQSYKWEPPKKLHPSEGTAYWLRVEEYLSYSYGKVAECLIRNYKSGDVLRYYKNGDIKPSSQEGFVLIRNGKVALRIITKAVYVG